MRPASATLLVLAALAPSTAVASTPKEVDPLIGTAPTGAAGFGNTVPGPSVPFGFAHPSPDTTELEPAGAADVFSSGYNPDGEILGFSQTHVSGTGGGSKYGNFRLTPFTGTPRLANLASPFGGERAAPGLYRVELRRHRVRAQLTATRRVAFHRYLFRTGRAGHVLLDASSAIALLTDANRQKVVSSRLCFRGPRTVVGTASFVDGWSHPGPYTLHFAARFDRRARTTSTWVRDRRRGVRCARAGREEQLGAMLTFPLARDRTVQAKVGLSFVSRSKARSNLRREIPGWSFKRVRERAERRWRRVLGRLSVRGGTRADRRILATALYHSHQMPHDLTGENVWGGASGPHYEDFYALWDTHRAQHPLLTVLQPRRERDMVRALIGMYRATGWMPDARVAGNNGLTQGGSSGDVLVADALSKGIRGIDYRTAYEALRKNAEVDSPRPIYEGRQVAEYDGLGYLSLSHERSASRTMEYSYNDFAVAQVARALGRRRDHARYLERSRSWANLWDPSTMSVRPRHADGRFLEDFDRERSYAFFEPPFYEGSAWQYSTYVPHDTASLIARVGGDDAFVRWLDDFFAAGQLNPANEVTTLTPYLYTHAGRPDRTAERVRHVVETAYGAGRDGLPGNDDAGSLSAWWIWSAIGVFPSAGQPFYYLTAPIFRRTTIELGGGRRFTIVARRASDERRYIQAATLNGGRLDRAWLRHRELARGGKLVLELGDSPSSWGRDPRPPSLPAR